MSFSDLDNNDSHTFTLSNNIINGIEWFSIDDDFSIIFNKNNANIELDYEALSIYNIGVTVTDSGSLSNSATITIFLIDMNEAPIIVRFIVTNVHMELWSLL